MYLESLRVYSFRNLADQTVRFSPTFNVLSGNNGQGKTNFVEALYVLSAGKSFRTSDINDLIRWQEEAASAFGEVVRGEEHYELGVIIKGGGREGVLDGQTLKTFSEFIGKLVAVTFTPQDLSLVKGAPQGRRSFMDRHIAETDPKMVKHLVAYQRALKSKAAVLRSEGAGEAELSPWNQLMSEHGLRIVQARLEFLKQIEVRARSVLAGLVPNEPEIRLSLHGDWTDAASVSDIFERLDAIAGRELQSGMCLSGVHRDEMLVELGEQNARAFASQGQTRTIVLGLKLAVIDYVDSVLGTSPVVVLDDVESELDEDRRKALFDFLSKRSGQVFLTGTDRTGFGSDGAAYFEVKNGQILAS